MGQGGSAGWDGASIGGLSSPRSARIGGHAHRSSPAMPPSAANPPSRSPAAIVLGYFNFSSGAFDPHAWRALSDLYAEVEPANAAGVVAEASGTAAAVATLLADRLRALEPVDPAFRDARRARGVLDVVFERMLPAYREFHGDLLEHQPAGAIERPFFLMSAAQAVLAVGGPEDDPQAVVDQAIERLNDYVGWRPVAVLENGRLSEPYRHERVRPVPLWMAGAGAAHGRYGRLVTTAIDILREAPPQLVRQADFDLEMLEELAFDPRAFDFLHPAASRPNYLFGLWDPARIDARGNYRRMVVQQATLDGILSWPDAEARGGGQAAVLEGELRWESAAVLAGVMLMASGLSGHGPGAVHAALPLADLLPRIAGYRDEFYRWLLARLPAAHRGRMEQEAARLRQPFGGVRRHINAVLAGRRACQVESVALAAVLARIGRAEGAERMAGAVPAASARLLSRITSSVVAAQQALGRGRGDPAAALEHLDAATEILFRAVGCGAAVDPWNILGLSGQFPLHEPGGESLPDPRVDDLVLATGSILDGYAAAWRQAGLDGPQATAARAAAALERLAGWWDRFATTTVSGVPHLSGREAFDSAREVIDALTRRREFAPASPPPGFWRREVAGFSSPRTHAQAAAALLHEGDLDGAAGLLVHWASLLEGPAIERTGPIWLGAANRWLGQAFGDRSPAGRGRVRRFLELVEANTSGVLDVIEAAAAGDRGADRGDSAAADDDQADANESVAAAYETMVWHDSADDGVDGGMIDVDLPGGDAVNGLAAVEHAAAFLVGSTRLLRRAVTTWCGGVGTDGHPAPGREESDAVIGWGHALRRQRRVLLRAAMAVAGRDTEPGPGTSAAEFDRLRWLRDVVVEKLVDAVVQVSETLWILGARLRMRKERSTTRAGRGRSERGAIGCLFAACFTGDVPAARRHLAAVRRLLDGKPVLYVPLSRGGRPDRIARARIRARLLERLAACLPRLGLVAETSAIVQLAKQLEATRPPGAASVSEFDRVFEAGTAALVGRIVVSAATPAPDEAEPEQSLVSARILDGLAGLVPRLLETWMQHARQLRLSVLERIRDDKAFATLREFIERYGPGLFTQQLLAPPSLRSILRGGVRSYLERLVEEAEPDIDDDAEQAAGGERPAPRRPAQLIEDLATGVLPPRQAAARLRLVLESVAENHAEYRDWNSTTTQSDRGECLHILLAFLRVKAEYDRIAWTLRPVSIAHRVLARHGATDAAEAWRGRMRDETDATAAALRDRLAELETKTGVRLASVSDRVRRPFTAALEQDELEALVPPAVAELHTGAPAGAGGRLEAKAVSFLGVASGSGVEVPEWLERLRTCVERGLERAEAGRPEGDAAAPVSLAEAVPMSRLPWADLRAELP